MKNLLATTAIALLAASPLAAQTAPTESDATTTGAAGVIYSAATDASDFYGSDLIGMTVYSSDTQYDDSKTVAAADTANWDNIGEVNDILISQDGKVDAVLIDVGGFLGIGEHTVALDMSKVHLLTDDGGNRFAAVNSSKDELEAAPAFERTGQADATAMNTGAAPAPADGTAAAPANSMAAAPADTTAPADQMAAGTPATRPAFDREGYAQADYATLTAEELDGATIYDANDESIGTISELVLDPDGKITQAVVDVGGFLGMGAHSVALSFDELEVMKSADSGDLRVYTNATKDELEQRPEYEG